MTPTIADTGPIVALVDHGDAHHRWAQVRFNEATPPLLVCEAVLTEACYLAGKVHNGCQAVLNLVAQGVLAIQFHLGDELAPVVALIDRYANVPMSLADACLVRMAELHEGSPILTLDRDFLIYRKNGREPLDAVLPEDRA